MDNFDLKKNILTKAWETKLFFVYSPSDRPTFNIACRFGSR